MRRIEASEPNAQDGVGPSMLTANEYGTLAELSTNAGRVLMALGARCGHLLLSDSWQCIDILSVFVIFLPYSNSINLARRRRWKPRRRDSPWTWTPPFRGG